MHTDYVGSEPRCCFIAKKLIWWVAVICCTGGAIDATGAVARAKAMSVQFMARPAPAAAKAEREPIRVSEIVAELPVTAAPAVSSPPVLPASPFRVTSADPLRSGADRAGNEVAG
jgi:hypothetical protein